MVIFACIQLILSQIPNFHELSWLSILAAVMSFAYSSIGLGLSLAQIVGKINYALSLIALTLENEQYSGDWFFFISFPLK